METWVGISNGEVGGGGEEEEGEEVVFETFQLEI